MLQRDNLNNLVRGTTFFQHSGIAITFVFMPIIASLVAESVFEIGIIVASFAFAQILTETYFGRMSDRKAKRLLFIRVGFILCAITFGLHYFADNTTYLIIARLGAGIASGIMIPPMLAYAYEAGKGKSKVASVISFHALGWMAGIVAAGLANDEKLIFVVSSCFFIIGFIISLKLPKIQTEKIVEKGIIKKIIVKNKFLFSSLLIRHIGAAAAWTVLPIMLMEYFGAELYQVSMIYVANTLTAFLVMNLMSKRIQIQNITKFKIGIGMTVIVFVGLALITDWWMAWPFMAIVGCSWAFLFIGGNFHLMENNPRSTSTAIFSSTLAISTVIGPVIAGIIAYYTDYTAVMIFAVVVTLTAFIISTKMKSEKPNEVPI
ncbi:MFS transporter [Candidatus Nitrosopelagicus sp.]|nr:MFS transporter [Candidatus Nitrosopelagicus sp.]MDC0241875.1 MFS transporter [Candidatus Nitrosopelagicus sp.]